MQIVGLICIAFDGRACGVQVGFFNLLLGCGKVAFFIAVSRRGAVARGIFLYVYRVPPRSKKTPFIILVLSSKNRSIFHR